ncbi:MAG: MFS transporter [Firmicutes bacterium]|nr:MFS transporter [Bacillota bacterium]
MTIGSFQRNLHLNYVYMFLLSLRFDAAFWVIFLRSRGFSFAAIGLLETVFHLSSFISEVPTGFLADRLGRKASLAFGSLAGALSAALMLLVRNELVIAVAFCFSALSYTFPSGAHDALVYDTCLGHQKERDFTRIAGNLNAIWLAGASVAALAGGWVAELALGWLYVLNILMNLTAVIVIWFIQEAREDGTPADGGGEVRLAQKPGMGGVIRSLRENPEMLRLFLLFGFLSAAETTAVLYGQAYLRAAGIPLPVIGGVFMAQNLFAILPTKMAFLAEKRVGFRSCLLGGGLVISLMIALLGALPRQNGPALQIVAVAIFLFLDGAREMLNPIFSNEINLRIHSTERATLLSFGSMVFSMMMMVLFPLVGIAGDRAGLGPAYLFLGVTTLAVIPIFSPSLRRRKWAPWR